MTGDRDSCHLCEGLEGNDALKVAAVILRSTTVVDLQHKKVVRRASTMEAAHCKHCGAVLDVDCVTLRDLRLE